MAREFVGPDKWEFIGSERFPFSDLYEINSLKEISPFSQDLELIQKNPTPSPSPIALCPLILTESARCKFLKINWHSSRHPYTPRWAASTWSQIPYFLQAAESTSKSSMQQVDVAPMVAMKIVGIKLLSMSSWNWPNSGSNSYSSKSLSSVYWIFLTCKFAKIMALSQVMLDIVDS